MCPFLDAGLAYVTPTVVRFQFLENETERRRKRGRNTMTNKRTATHLPNTIFSPVRFRIRSQIVTKTSRSRDS